MIVIHVFPDGTFKTACGLSDAVDCHVRESKKALAVIAGGLTTYASDVEATPQGWHEFVNRHLRGQFRYVDDNFVTGRITGDAGHAGMSLEPWKHWAAHCSIEFDAWFTEVSQ